MRSVRRVLAALLAPALLGGAGSLGLATLGPAAPAAAVTKPCVAVLVDGRMAGGSVTTGCATGDPSSGLEALTDAGVSYAFVPRQPGQVCQLDGLPECARTGADTYWSYWWRAKGSTRWVYATQGAGSHDPEPGDTEGWVWQEGGKVRPPGTSFAAICPQAQQSQQSQQPRQSATPEPAATSTSPMDNVPDLTATPTATKPTEALSADPTTSSASPTPVTSTPASTPATASAARSAPPVAKDDDTTGAPWTGLAIGAGAVALLGGAAFARFRRTGGSS